MALGSSVCLASIPTAAGLALPGGPQVTHHGLLTTKTGPHNVTPLLNQQRAAGFLPIPAGNRPPTAAHEKTRPDAFQQISRIKRYHLRIDAHRIDDPVSRQPRLTYVTVRSGDTLWGISKRYHVRLTDLERWNHLSVQNSLQIGQKLSLSGPAPLPGPAVTRYMAAASPPNQSQTQSEPQALDTGPHNANANPKTPTRSQTHLRGLGFVAIGQRIVNYARRFLGIPYVWGGSTPSGFDCSGFVLFTFAHFGIRLSRTSYQQFRDGTPVYRADLIPGDLVFFDTDGPGASHVGIYTGANHFISASGPKVQINNLNSLYWASHFLGGRRTF